MVQTLKQSKDVAYRHSIPQLFSSFIYPTVYWC